MPQLIYLAEIPIGGVSTHYGVGRHTYYLSPSQISQAVKLASVSTLMFAISTMLIRLSICLFLLLIFGIKTKWRLICYSIIGFIIATQVPAAVSTFCACTPVQKQWLPDIDGRCWSRKIQNDFGVYVSGGKRQRPLRTRIPSRFH